MGVNLSIEDADFENVDDDFIQLMTDYIDSQRTKLYINNRKKNTQLTFSEEVDIIYSLCLFYSSLTQGDFYDRTLIIPKIDYNIGFFSKYKRALVDGLSELNLDDDASFMENHFKGMEISELNRTKLDAHFWNESYKSKLKPILAQFLKSKKDKLVALQEYENNNSVFLIKLENRKQS